MPYYRLFGLKLEIFASIKVKYVFRAGGPASQECAVSVIFYGEWEELGCFRLFEQTRNKYIAMLAFIVRYAVQRDAFGRRNSCQLTKRISRISAGYFRRNVLVLFTSKM